MPQPGPTPRHHWYVRTEEVARVSLRATAVSVRIDESVAAWCPELSSFHATSLVGVGGACILLQRASVPFHPVNTQLADSAGTPLLCATGYAPLLGVDIWEHAYYLDYKNVRPVSARFIVQVYP